LCSVYGDNEAPRTSNLQAINVYNIIVAEKTVILLDAIAQALRKNRLPLNLTV
jgi:hypothetical protein